MCIGLIQKMKLYKNVNQFIYKRPCNFKDCDGIMEVFPCGCWECKKCKKTDGTECEYM